jgi:hypothetical protein
MTEAVERPREDETAPVDTPAGPPADDLDSLLEQWDQTVGKAETEQSDNLPTQSTTDDQSVDQQLADLLRSPEDTQRISDLEGELGSVRQQELDRQSRSDFQGFSQKLQAELGPNVPDDYARTQLLAMATERPELQAAWNFRHLTAEQRRAADLEFQQLEALYWKAQQAPDDPRKAQALAQMERRGQELGLMMNAQKILNGVWRDVQRRAEKVLPAIDSEVTAARMELAQIIRDGGSNRAAPPMPQVRLGTLSDSEFRKHLLETYGIAGF